MSPKYLRSIRTPPDEGADGVDGELELWAESEEDAGDRLHHLLSVDLPREARLDHATLATQRQRVVEAVVVHLWGKLCLL